MTKRTIAALATAAAMGAAAPGAAAETATFSGTCAITGVSTFDPPLTSSHQVIEYDFKSGPPAADAADATTCSGTLNGASVSDMPVKAQVSGEGDLSCSSGTSLAPGKGSLEFPDGSTFPFDFSFTAVATEVDFTAAFAGGEQATGHASFLHYAPPTSVFDCGPAGGGLSALGFDATTDETSGTIQGTKPDAGSPDSGPTETGGSDETSQKGSSTKAKRKACMKKAKKKKRKKRRAKAKKRCKRIN